MGKMSGSGSGMNNPDNISESLETIFWVKILQFFDADKGSRMEKIWIRDGKNSDPGQTTRILNPDPLITVSQDLGHLSCLFYHNEQHKKQMPR
jgi:hypothetical protein